MKDYTYQDMLRMQEDAAERVREMKKRASIITDEAPAAAVTENGGGLLKTLLSDTASLLIVSVLSLLASEGSDNFTQLALLYILL